MSDCFLVFVEGLRTVPDPPSFSPRAQRESPIAPHSLHVMGKKKGQKGKATLEEVLKDVRSLRM
jgi:hypothetical protein